jgi:hypothetical protein
MDFNEIIPERYRTSYDNETGAFRILDTWHDSIKNIPDITTAIIDDASPALKTLSTEQVNSLIGILIKLGWLDKIKTQTTATTQKITPPPVKDFVPVEKVKSIEEIAITKIAEIAQKDSINNDLAREAITAIRNLGGTR